MARPVPQAHTRMDLPKTEAIPIMRAVSTEPASIPLHQATVRRSRTPCGTRETIWKTAAHRPAASLMGCNRPVCRRATPSPRTMEVNSMWRKASLNLPSPLPKNRSSDHGGRYQMRTRSAGSSHMASPSCTSNALANRSTLRTMPLVRHSAGECGSICRYCSASSSRFFVRQMEA